MHVPARAIAAYSLPTLLIAVMGSSLLGAQAGPAVPPQPPPFIATSAVGEARITPDRATLHVAVESRGQSAAAAAAENARLQTRVIEAVKAAGVAAAQIRTAGYNISPEYAYQEGKAPRVTGYRAANTVQVEIRNIATVAKVIDAALGAGATNIGALQMYPSNPDAARREALQQAVAKARADAEALAGAAGGSLGALIEMSSTQYEVPRPVEQAFAAMARADVAPTPIETGEYRVTASVQVRWQFVPQSR